MSQPFFTIGHSTRPIEQFVALLKDAQIGLVADVRTVPRSRANPQYEGNELGRTLSQCGIDYRHIAALGGLRGKQQVSPEVNAFWENQSFHNYADYALTEMFRSALKGLCALGHEQRCAVMCAEAVWWRCHRRIVADYLIAAGESVFHILGEGHVAPATLNPAAKPGTDGALVYPRLEAG